MDKYEKMFLRLIQCPNSYEMALVIFLQDLIYNSTVPQFLLTLSELMTTMDEEPVSWVDERKAIELLFNDVTEILNLKHGNIRSLVLDNNTSTSGKP